VLFLGTGWKVLAFLFFLCYYLDMPEPKQTSHDHKVEHQGAQGTIEAGPGHEIAIEVI
jgi:hypothetical protein